jgi:hypothetical protein
MITNSGKSTFQLLHMKKHDIMRMTLAGAVVMILRIHPTITCIAQLVFVVRETLVELE